MSMAVVLAEVIQERVRQDEKWGEQNHPDGTGLSWEIEAAKSARRVCDRKADLGTVSWADILHEEYAEALAERDVERLREELVQVAAVAVAWIEAIDRRAA